MQLSIRSPSSSLLSLFVWILLRSSSTVSAQTNSIRLGKSCYILGEGLVVSFTDANPQFQDELGIVNATATVNVVRIQSNEILYTCGSNACKGAAPFSGIVSIFNLLPVGNYKAVLLRNNAFNSPPLAVSTSFKVATTCPAIGGPTPTSNTLRISKSCYAVNEGVVATFTETKPQIGDQVGLIPASANVRPGVSIAYFALVKTCGTYNCSAAPSRGTVSVFNSVSPGRYKLVLVQGPRLIPLVVSSNFVIAVKCGIISPTKPATRAPTRPVNPPVKAPIRTTSRPTLPPPINTVPIRFPTPAPKPPTKAPIRPITAPVVARNSVRVAKACYNPNQYVFVSFVDVGARVGDRVGLINATVDVNGNEVGYPSVVFTCGTFNCTTAPPSGQVKLYQSFSPAKYKAVLLRGSQLIALAVSSIFTIATSCP